MESQTTQLKPPPQPSNGSGRMGLNKIVKGRIAQPLRLVLYGPPGIGKSTFAAGSPSPIYLGAEKGTAQLDVERFPQPEAWLEALEALSILERQEHGYKTVVIDTVDWIEPLIHTHVIDEDNAGKPASRAVKDIDAMGFGRGYNLALVQWRKLIVQLDRLCELRAMNVILLAHSQIRKFQNPEGDDFDRFEMKLHHKAGGYLQEWADEVFFANYETATHEIKGRVRGISSGVRQIYTNRTAAYDAKNRHDLPDRLPLSWADYAAAVAKGAPAELGDIKAAIAELLPAVPEDTKEKASKAVADAGDNPAKLSKILNRLKAMRKE